ncbi:MAG TPA: NAD(P)-dependent alcohol dehydrogenase [Thermoanaerobaculia bacterium]|nr:NAD(P)-dependent alcohol dehydrogenase [Thermoanaerobaculia bacterium]
MKAIVYSQYGSPDVLHCEEIAKPTPADHEVLIRVRAAALNPLDWHFMRGTPYFMRLMSGLRRPKVKQLGVDVAGEVEALGSGVTRFAPGDAVFGTCRGAFAEYACAAESALATKPDNVTFEQAAAANVAAFTALQALRHKGELRAGQKVLVNGAAGGVGTFAVQIAKALGADVTAVCSTHNLELVRSLGADRVIDYTQEDFTREGAARYDLVLDCIGNHSLAACRRVLAPSGRYVQVGGQGGQWLGPLPRALAILVLSRLVSQELSLMLARGSQADLVTMRDLMAAGRVRPVIDRRYSLAAAPEAIRYLEAGHARGKVVLAV